MWFGAYIGAALLVAQQTCHGGTSRAFFCLALVSASAAAIAARRLSALVALVLVTSTVGASVTCSQDRSTAVSLMFLVAAIVFPAGVLSSLWTRRMRLVPRVIATALIACVVAVLVIALGKVKQNLAWRDPPPFANVALGSLKLGLISLQSLEMLAIGLATLASLGKTASPFR